MSQYPVIGLWFVDGEPAGISIHEETTLITTDRSTFAPHSISDGPVNYERQPVPDILEIETSLSLELVQFQKASEPPKSVFGHVKDVLKWGYSRLRLYI